MEKLILNHICNIKISKDWKSITGYENEIIENLEYFIIDVILNDEYNLNEITTLNIVYKSIKRYKTLINNIYKITNLDNIFVLKELLNCEAKLLSKRLEKLGGK